jgi:HSP20 family protein
MNGAIASESIDATIGRVERLYSAVTGRSVPPRDEVHSAIPAEKDPSQHVEEQLDKLLNLLGETGLSTAAPPWTPPLSVWESAGETLICMDLPGVTRERVDIVLQGNVLTITGQRPLPVRDQMRLRMSERPLGSFRRTIVLSGPRAGEPSAQLRDGVLEIRIRRDASAASPQVVPVS